MSILNTKIQDLTVGDSLKLQLAPLAVLAVVGVVVAGVGAVNAIIQDRRDMKTLNSHP